MFDALSKHCFFRTLLFSLGLLFRRFGTRSVQVIIFQNLDCAALRAMTSLKCESAIMLFVVFLQLLKLCGAIHNYDHQTGFTLRRIDRSLFQQLSDCAADVWVNTIFYNTLTPTEYCLDYKFYFESQYLIFLESVHNQFIVTSQ